MGDAVRVDRADMLPAGAIPLMPPLRLWRFFARPANSSAIVKPMAVVAPAIQHSRGDKSGLPSSRPLFKRSGSIREKNLGLGGIIAQLFRLVIVW